ncbi:MAG: toxin, partial [Candidatus Rokubacteria bacterium]|nr:toxin [Candidatus Rokubacteria bacterium]MDO8479145.1 toxin [Candidatus Rokubacteria bacterium]
MRRFRWNPEKNEALKAEPGISFERIVLAIEDGDVLDVLRHP